MKSLLEQYMGPLQPNQNQMVPSSQNTHSEATKRKHKRSVPKVQKRRGKNDKKLRSDADIDTSSYDAPAIAYQHVERN